MMTKPSLTVVTLLALLGTGCAENEESLIVLMAPAWEMGGCVITADTSAASLPYGMLDLTYGTPYAMPAILLNNTAEEAANANNSGVQSNELQLIDADVDLSMPQAPDVLEALRDMDESLVSFNVPLSTNSLPPGGAAGVLVEVIPQRTSMALGDVIAAQIGANAKLTVQAAVQFHASRSGNSIGKVGEIDARDFSFPIQVCFGCLTTCVSCPDAECPVEATEWGGGVCGNAQDLEVYPAVCGAPAG
jgi:hypothetical protein